jgi:hypothetical protein
MRQQYGRWPVVYRQRSGDGTPTLRAKSVAAINRDPQLHKRVEPRVEQYGMLSH